MTIILCDEILDLARRRVFYPVASDEVVCELVLLGVAEAAVAVRPAIGSVCFGHGGRLFRVLDYSGYLWWFSNTAVSIQVVMNQEERKGVEELLIWQKLSQNAPKTKPLEPEE